MSLVNDALKRARVEALRQEATREGLDYRAVPAHSRRDPRSAVHIAAWVVAAVALGAVVWLVSRPPTPRGRTLESPLPVAGLPRLPAATGEARVGDSVGAAVEGEAPAVEEERSPDSAPPIEDDRVASSAPSAPPPEPETPARIPPVERANDDESLPSPQVSPGTSSTPEAASARLQDGATYLRRATSADGSMIELGGIAYSEDRPIAVINGSVVSPGDMIAGYTIVAIEPERVELEVDGVRVYLSLH